MNITNFRLPVLIITATLITASCTTPKNITYMQGFNEGDVQAVASQRRITVQPDDKLSILVSSKDPQLAQVFNLMVSQLRSGQTNTSGTSGSGQNAAFTVSPDGTINYPVLGELHVAGLSRKELASMIEQKILERQLLKDPIVTVEFLNATVSILGDVRGPGEYPITRDNMNILQALSKAGDLQITGQRKNVLVVREENGKDVAYRVDLTDTKALMESPAFHLQQNDVIYVEPNNMAKRQSQVNGNNLLTPGFWMSIASFLASMSVLIFK